MSGYIGQNESEELNKDVEVDKFMDFILEEETKRKPSKKQQPLNEGGVRKVIRRISDRPANNIRFGKK